MMRVLPKETLRFAGGCNSEVLVELTSACHIPIIYKIQTTSPEKFRVRPRCGILEPKQSVQVSILLKPECQLAENPKDKFLVACTPAPMELDLSTTQRIADAWKEKYPNLNIAGVEQHRLTCMYESKQQPCQKGTLGTMDESCEKPKGSNNNLDLLAEQATRMEKQLRFTQLLQYFTLFVLLVVSVAIMFLLRYEINSGSSKAPLAAVSPTSLPTSLRSRIMNPLGQFSRQPRSTK